VKPNSTQVRFCLTVQFVGHIQEYCTAEVLKWWVATQKWVAESQFLTLSSIEPQNFETRDGSRPDCVWELRLYFILRTCYGLCIRTIS
jgi:hypothetical protein